MLIVCMLSALSRFGRSSRSRPPGNLSRTRLRVPLPCRLVSCSCDRSRSGALGSACEVVRGSARGGCMGTLGGLRSLPPFGFGGGCARGPGLDPGDVALAADRTACNVGRWHCPSRRPGDRLPPSHVRGGSCARWFVGRWSGPFGWWSPVVRGGCGCQCSTGLETVQTTVPVRAWRWNRVVRAVVSPGCAVVSPGGTGQGGEDGQGRADGAAGDRADGQGGTGPA